jgi:NACalpha-BTF3-like transcription factor
MENITDDDINILVAQGNITKKEATELLVLNNGDLVESIVTVQMGDFDLEKLRKEKNEYVEEETDDFTVDTSKQENLTKYREIVDSKDIIYNRKKQEKEEKEKRIKEGKEEETNFSIEELYKLKRGNNTFNSIRVL